MGEIVISDDQWNVDGLNVSITKTGGFKGWQVEVRGPVVADIPFDVNPHTLRYRVGGRSWWERIFSWPWRPFRGWRWEYVGSVYVESISRGYNYEATLVGDGPLHERAWHE